MFESNFVFNFYVVCLSMCDYSHGSAYLQKGASFILDGVIGCCELPHLELGTKLKSSVRTTNATNC